MRDSEVIIREACHKFDDRRALECLRVPKNAQQ